MENIEEAIKHTAYVIHQERKRRGDPDADDDKKNWRLAKERLGLNE
ncbi:MAG: hypothetical protein WC569_02270 [Candidatus Omnitrophota bacterium]